jgi:hypothetical protein
MQNAIKKSPKIRQKYYCEKCDYSCCKKSDYDKHIDSKKHNATKCYKNATLSSLICECGKKYKHSSSFYRHKKNCSIEQNNVEQPIEQNNKGIQDTDNNTNEVDYKEMFLHMMKQNQDLQKTMKEMIPNIGNNNNNNINNNKFNINVFLNETCKDALNIMDFVNSLKLQITDLENTSKMGFIDGTSKIIIDGLKELELHQRPVHCSDLQNKILYVKDNDMWGQDTDNKDKMKRVIDEVTKANMKQLPKWITENPTYANDEEYMKIVSNIMNMDVDNDKSEIISNVSKEVILNNDNNNKLD